MYMNNIYLYESSIGVYHQIVIQFLLHFVKRKYMYKTNIIQNIYLALNVKCSLCMMFASYIYH